MSAGLPQLDTALFPAQLFWLAVSFALLYALMAFVALPSVRRTQDKRAAVISDDLAAAAKANEEAKALMAAYEKALRDARMKAQAIINESAVHAAREAAKKHASKQEELGHRLAAAEAAIAAARDAALKDIRGNVTELAAAIVDKISGVRG
jgi:F-type H+-transporting ATPase subunit b